jgi:hypothetical protein
MGLGRVGSGVGKGAKSGYIPGADFSPVGKYGRKKGAHFTGPELQKAVTRPPRESIGKTLGESGVQPRPVVRWNHGQTTVRCENRSQRI